MNTNVIFLKHTLEGIWQQFKEDLKNKKITVAALIWAEDSESYTCCISPLTKKARDVETLQVLLEDCKYALLKHKFGELENDESD